MQNTFSQSGNDSKWFLKNIIFQNRVWNSRPPPLYGKNILNFLFDYWINSLSNLLEGAVKKPPCIY